MESRITFSWRSMQDVHSAAGFIYASARRFLLAVFFTFLTMSEIFSQDVSYSPLYDNATFDSRSVNVSLPVGSLPGTADVSASGGSSYSIPIILPPGTNGTVPSISISYNSQGGNGPLGMRWGLSGLSYITRTSRNMYFDGQVNAVGMDNNDPFILDGTRLIVKTGSNGAPDATYGLETEDFSTITSKNTQGYGPEYFEVLTKDGVKMEYGSNPYARLTGQYATVLTWALTKILYPNGNYITFNYKTDAYFALLIDEINYTGNDLTGIIPYNKIKFAYKLRTIDKNAVFENGTSVYSKYLLDKITITADGQSVSSYQLNYGHDNINSFLKEIVQSGTDGISLNATVFKYGDIPAEFGSVPASTYDNPAATTLTGDFDGDGLTDYLKAELLSSPSVYRLTIYAKEKSYSAAPDDFYVSNVTDAPTTYTVVKKKDIPNSYDFLAYDFTGDGADDVLMTNVAGSGSSRTLSNVRLYKTVQNYDWQTNGLLPIQFTTTDISPYSGYSKIHSSGHFLFVGDFNGDGIQDMLTMLGTSSSSYYSHLYFGNISTGFLTAGTTGTVYFPMANWPTVDKVHILDFNGDGKSDLMLIKDGNCEIFTFDSYSARRIFYTSSSSYLQKNSLLYFGDFNADGKTDILAKNTLNGLWKILVSDGQRYNTESNFSFFTTPNTDPYTGDQLAVGDFNGDGKSDIYHARKPSGATLASFDIYYGRGYDYGGTNTADFNRVNSTSSINLGAPPHLIGDFNADGKADVLNYKNATSSMDIFYFRREGKENLVEKVKNGYNHLTEWSYKRLANDNNFYIRGNLSNYPFNAVQPALLTVSEQKVQYSSSSFITTQYNYEGGKLHRAGKGFIGFSKITASNLGTGVRNVSENQFNTTYFAPFAYRSSSYLITGGALLKQTIFTVAFVSPASKRFWTKITGTEENKAFEGRSVSSTNTWDSYGNITNSTVASKGGSTIVHTTATTNVYTAYVTAIPNRLTSNSVSQTRAGQPAYSSTTTFGYNTLGQQTSKTDFSGLTNNVVTTYEYFGDGNLKKTTVAPFGMTARSNSLTYDSKGRYPSTSTNALSQSASTTYDPRWGTPLSQTGVDGLSTSFEYDQFGRLKKSTYPEGFSVNQSLGWDLSGQSVWYSLVSHPGRPDVKTWYNIIGRDIKIQTEAFPASSGWITVSKGYDSRGNLVYEAAPYKTGEAFTGQFSYEYDAYNRLTRVYQEENLEVGQTTYGYSYASGNLTSSVTKMGIVPSSSQTSNRVTDAAGKVVSSTDYGGTLTYTYYSHGGIKETKQGSTILTSSLYDAYGNQTSLTDINGGTTTYNYNSLGQQTAQTNSNGQSHSMGYDLNGKIISRSGTEGMTSQEYYTSGTGINQIKKITGFSGNLEEFTYDSYGRLATVKETVDAAVHTTSYGYNSYGDITSILYPSGFGVKQAFDGNGYLRTIKNNAENVTLYTSTSLNGSGQVTEYSLGNTKSTTRSYKYGFPTQYQTTGLQNLEMTWNFATGMFTKRKDLIKNKEESFTYDNLDRLLSATVVGASAQATTYNANGNIATKSDAGTYTYHATKVNAVTEVTNPGSVISSLTQDITYNAFMQPSVVSETISGVVNEISYIYGAGYNRLRGVMKQGGSTINTRYYFSEGYEKDVVGTDTRYTHYVSSPAGLIAIVTREGSTDTYNYVYTDHLGSIVTTTNETGTITAEQNFDAWGRRRNATSWALLSPTAVTSLPNWLYRGYTGHEHLDKFGLINMNGRVYDPVIGRMHSPDNNVADGSFTQDYNRYSYARNNPLVFSDPSGEFLNIAFMGMAFTAEFLSNVLTGKGSAFKTAAKAAYTNTNAFSSAFQFKVFSSGNTTMTAGLDPLALGVSANFYVSKGDVSTNFGVGVGYGGFNYNWGVSYSPGKFDISIGGGGGNNHSALGGGLKYNGYGVNYYQTYYGATSGPAGAAQQTVGGLGISAGKFSFRIENDFLEFNDMDRWRSNAVEISYGNLTIGTRLYNNDPAGEKQGVDPLGTDRMGNRNKNFKGKEFGSWDSGKVYESPLWVGLRVGNTIDRIGYSHSMVQDRTQNWVHRNGFFYLPFGHQNFYVDDKDFKKGMFSTYGYFNQYSLWGR